MLYFVIYIIISLIFFLSSERNEKISNGALAAILLVLALIVGLGDMLGGYDRYGYCQLFDQCADQLRAGRDLWARDNAIMGYSSEMSYVLLNMGISYVTENRYIFILITTLIMYLMIFLCIKEYIDKYPFAILMFLSLFFFFTFTYLRQALATCFCWYAYRYVINRKFLKFAIFTFIAYKFHNSAIVFFPFYFVPMKKYPRNFVFSTMGVLLLIGLTGLPSSLYGIYGDATGADARTAQYEVYGHTTRIEYILEAFVFLYFIFQKYDKIPNDPKYITLLNSALAFCAFLLFFVTSSAAGRQSWYYMMGIIGVLSYLSSIKGGKTFAGNLYVILLLLFIRFVFSWGMLITPYKSFLTNGHREGDFTFYGWEYDEKYDKDKFYRKAIDIQW